MTAGAVLREQRVHRAGEASRIGREVPALADVLVRRRNQLDRLGAAAGGARYPVLDPGLQRGRAGLDGRLIRAEPAVVAARHLQDDLGTAGIRSIDQLIGRQPRPDSRRPRARTAVTAWCRGNRRSGRRRRSGRWSRTRS